MEQIKNINLILIKNAEHNHTELSKVLVNSLIRNVNLKISARTILIFIIKFMSPSLSQKVKQSGMDKSSDQTFLPLCMMEFYFFETARIQEIREM